MCTHAAMMKTFRQLCGSCREFKQFFFNFYVNNLYVIKFVTEEVYSSPHLLFRDIIHEERNQQTSDGANPIRHAH